MSSLLLHFPPFRLDPSNERLWDETQEIPLRPKTFAVLRYLVERPDQLVTKEELVNAVWPDTVVGDDALTGCIRDLRKALGDEAKTPRYIETVHRRGYRFLPPVTTQPVPSTEFRVLSQEEVASSQYSVVSREEEKQQASLESRVESLESKTPSTPLDDVQTLDPRLSDARLSDPNPQPRRVHLGRQIAAGLMLLVAIFLAVRFWFSSTPNPQSPTPNPQPSLSTQHSELGTEQAPQALALPDKPSIAVMPFTNMSGDPEQEYFSDGLTDDLITDLSRLSGLFVIARHSVFTYKGKAVKVQEISRELGVRYVLEGSVQKTTEQVRINAQLVDATTGHHLWAERYDQPLQDIFALQDEIVQQIVTTLGLQLRLQEQGVLVRKATDNLQAYDYYLQGRDYRNRFTKEANAQARQLFERALVLDPMYAAAYVELGWTYYMEWEWKWSQDPQALERALALGQKGIALDDSLARAHGLLGFIYARKNQYDQAIVEGERAIALDPNNADGYALQAGVLLFASRAEDALRAIEQGMRLNPHSPAWYLQQLGNAYQGTGRYEEAIAAHKQLLVRNPNFLWAYPNLAFSYLAQWGSQLSADPQTLEWALEAAQRAVTLNDSLFMAHRALGYVYLVQKQYELAIAEMERAIALDSNDAGSYAGLAEILSRVGRADEALRAAEQALRLKPLTVDGHLYSIGSAYYLVGRTEEAIASLKQFLARYPNQLGPHLTLAAIYSELGKEAEARAEAAEVLRLNPQFSLEVHKQRAPIKDPVTLERQIAALRKAGLK